MKVIRFQVFDLFKIDSYKVEQYEETRVVDTVIVVSTPKPRQRLVLCFSPKLRGNVLIPKSELKQIVSKEMARLYPKLVKP